MLLRGQPSVWMPQVSGCVTSLSRPWHCEQCFSNWESAPISGLQNEFCGAQLAFLNEIE